MFGIKTLASKQGPKWRGKIVLYIGDNMNVVSWLRTFQSTNRIVRHLLRCLSSWSGDCGFIFLPVYIRFGNHRIQDWLTRAKAEEVLAYMEKFGLCCPLPNEPDLYVVPPLLPFSAPTMP